MELAAEGKNSPEIALVLQVSKRTVDFHKDNAYKKLGASNIVDALIKSGFLVRPEVTHGN